MSQGRKHDDTSPLATLRFRKAKQLYGLSYEDIEMDKRWKKIVGVNEKTIRHWLKKGVPIKYIARIALYFELPGYYFDSYSISDAEFTQAIYTAIFLRDNPCPELKKEFNRKMIRISTHQLFTENPIDKYIWSQNKMNLFEEASAGMQAIWVVTPDLEPDVSSDDICQVVRKNIESGKKYVYFFPEDLPMKELELAKLKINLRLSDNSLINDRVLFVPLSGEDYNAEVLHNTRCNTAIYFENEGEMKCFQEIYISKLPYYQRDFCWQELSRVDTNEVHQYLRRLYDQAIKDKG